MKICGRSEENFLKEIEKFHGWKAPGIVMGGFMVDLAMELVGQGVEADAISETFHCLPDAIQLFTPCTVGNGWMKILDWDKFALTLYDRKTLNGFRVWLDLNKTRVYPNLYKWYMRLVPKKELPLELLHESIFEAGRSIYSSKPVTVVRYYERRKKAATDICSGCGESYPTSQGSQCLSCRDERYYEYR